MLQAVLTRPLSTPPPLWQDSAPRGRREAAQKERVKLSADGPTHSTAHSTLRCAAQQIAPDSGSLHRSGGTVASGNSLLASWPAGRGRPLSDGSARSCADLMLQGSKQVCAGARPLARWLSLLGQGCALAAVLALPGCPRGAHAACPYLGAYSGCCPQPVSCTDTPQYVAVQVHGSDTKPTPQSHWVVDCQPSPKPKPHTHTHNQANRTPSRTPNRHPKRLPSSLLTPLNYAGPGIIALDPALV
ncbi:hypothetical protein BC831DRAFT_4534 [Entophlyctis helioformis]|nr:hypothetical protein BC831DRAFT_4534 [Entophlyctis helioformis]